MIKLNLTLSDAAAGHLRVEAVDNLELDLEENGEGWPDDTQVAVRELIDTLRAALDAAGVS